MKFSYNSFRLISEGEGGKKRGEGAKKGGEVALDEKHDVKGERHEPVATS